MRANDIQMHRRKEPFVPFRVFLSDGSRYDVYHPWMMFVTQVEVGIGVNLDEDEIPEKFAYCTPGDVERIEPLRGRNTKRKTRRRA